MAVIINGKKLKGVRKWRDRYQCFYGFAKEQATYIGTFYTAEEAAREWDRHARLAGRKPEELNNV